MTAQLLAAIEEQASAVYRRELPLRVQAVREYNEEAKRRREQGASHPCLAHPPPSLLAVFGSSPLPNATSIPWQACVCLDSSDVKANGSRWLVRVAR